MQEVAGDKLHLATLLLVVVWYVYLAGKEAASAAACNSSVNSKSAAVYDEKMQSP